MRSLSRRRQGFNPRTREGCDEHYGTHWELWQVSIHAPARGATRSIGRCWTEARFQSTHPRGVRQEGRHLFPERLWFQSTHPRGVRRSPLGRDLPCPCFNPRTREGCDSGKIRVPELGERFNPRTREGCDRRQGRGAVLLGEVSIHAPARGATPDVAGRWHRHQVSIHAPARGATAHRQVTLIRIGVSIHAPARGATVRRSTLCLTV